LSKQLVKNVATYFAASSLAQGLNFVLWLILAQLLDPTLIGIYGLALFVIDFFTAVAICGLDATVTRFYYSADGLPTVLSNAAAVLLCSSLVSLFGCCLAAGLIVNVMPSLSVIFSRPLFLSIILANTLANFAFAHYSALKKAALYGKLQLFRIGSLFVLSTTFVLLGRGLQGVLEATLASSLCTAAVLFRKEGRHLRQALLSRPVATDILAYGLPLMLYSVFGVIVAYFSRVLLERSGNLVTLGVYSFFLVLAMQVNGLWSTFNRAWTPEVFSLLRDDRAKAIQNVRLMTFLLSCGYLIGLTIFICVGELFLFKLVFKEIYRGNIHLLYILLLGPLFSGIYTASYPLYYYQHKTSKILLVSVALSTANTLVTLVMVTQLGQDGASLSFLLFAIVTTLTYLVVFRRLIGIPRILIGLTLRLTVLLSAAVALLLTTGSSSIFVIALVVAAAVTFKTGDLARQKDMLVGALNATTLRWKQTS
jgi:O-antigen/teichoic acid export membrane protein